MINIFALSETLLPKFQFFFFTPIKNVPLPNIFRKSEKNIICFELV